MATPGRTPPRNEREYYSRYYRTRQEDSPSLSRIRAQRIVGQMARELPAGGVYLGLGTGRGMLEAAIYKDSLRHLAGVYLLDIAEREPLIKPIARKGGIAGRGNVVNLEADAQQIPLADNSVDLISCHLAQDLFPERRKSTEEIRRVLKPGSAAVLFLHHAAMFETEMRNNPTFYGKKGKEIAEFWQKLIDEGRVFRKKEDVERHFSSHGLHVESVIEHAPRNGENASNYWWEVIVRKPKS